MGYYKNLSIGGSVADHIGDSAALDTREYRRAEMAATPKTKQLTTAPVPRLVGPNHYKIDSASRTLVSYDMTLEEHGWACTCEGYHYRFNCRHIHTLLRHLADQPRLAKREAVTLESLFA